MIPPEFERALSTEESAALHKLCDVGHNVLGKQQQKQALRGTTIFFSKFLRAAILIPISPTPLPFLPITNQAASQGLSTPSKYAVLSTILFFHLGGHYTVIDGSPADNEDGNPGRNAAFHSDFSISLLLSLLCILL